MKPVFKSIALTHLILIGIAVSSCSPSKPEQLNLILRVDANRPTSLRDIVSAMANRTGLQVTSQDFDYGGKNGLLKAFLMSGSRISVMIRGTSEEECHSQEGRRDPTFSRSVYGVSIYRTSLFKPKIDLQQAAVVLREEAQRRGGDLLSENQKCADGVQETAKNVSK